MFANDTSFVQISLFLKASLQAEHGMVNDYYYSITKKTGAKFHAFFR